MIHPAPTTPIEPTLARGVLAAIHPPHPPHSPHSHSASSHAEARGHLVLTFANTNYQTHLIPAVDPATLAEKLGKRILGTIALSARRIDVVDAGGKYLEPVYGRPRRVQGKIIAVNRRANTLVVDAAVPIHVNLTDARQHADDFKLGDLVSFDALDGATFTPVA